MDSVEKGVTDAKEAIGLAKRYVAEFFGDEGVSNIGLEEVFLESGLWDVTVGFSRPWDAVRDAQSIITGAPTLQRSYKRVLIQDSDKRLVKISNR